MFNIRVRVRHLVEKYGTANPFLLTSYLNINILHAPLPDKINGFLVRVLRRKYIVLNDKLSYEEQKVTLCHEIGHARLHSGYNYCLHAEQSYYIPSHIEAEANEFAIRLLAYSEDIDDERIVELLRQKNPNPHEVHDILGRIMYRY